MLNRLRIDLMIMNTTEESGRVIIALTDERGQLLHVATARQVVLYGTDGRITEMVYNGKTTHHTDIEGAVDYVTDQEAKRINRAIFNLSNVY